MSNDSSQPADDKTVDDLFPSRWLKASDLAGRRFDLTIRRVTLEEMQGQDGPEVNPVVWFQEAKKKGLILNKTNAEAISNLHGRGPLRTWAGKRITIYPTTTKAFGKIHDVIRVAPTAPAPVQATPTTEPDPAPPESLDDDPDLWTDAGPHDTGTE